MYILKRNFIANLLQIGISLALALGLSKGLFAVLQFPFDMSSYMISFYVVYIAIGVIISVVYEYIYPRKIVITDKDIRIFRFWKPKVINRDLIEIRVYYHLLNSETYIYYKDSNRKIKTIQQNVYDNYDAIKFQCL